MDKKDNREHSLSMLNRSVISLSGVLEVSEFSNAKVNLKTSMAGLCVRGKKLTVNQLNTDAGTLDIKGEIQSLQYSGGKDGFFAGLFK